jgi:hypothetical protein
VSQGFKAFRDSSTQKDAENEALRFSIVSIVGDNVRRCLGEGADSESGMNIFNNFTGQRCKRCTFDFNHLRTPTVACCFLRIITLGMAGGAGARNGIGRLPTRQYSQRGPSCILERRGEGCKGRKVTIRVLKCGRKCVWCILGCLLTDTLLPFIQ